MRPEPQPIGTLLTPNGVTISKWSHRVELTPTGRADNRWITSVKCLDCGWHGKYPSREHARAVADEHMIHSHSTGADFCGSGHNGKPQPRYRCDGCAAIKRKAQR